MDNNDDIREFLTTRRAKITPERAGLPTYGRHRRVSGLRREEVALVAGISVEYYTRLERGNAAGVSDEVLHAVAAALQLDDAERAPRRAPSPQRVRPGIARIVDAITDVAAFVQNGRGDIVYANALASAIYSDLDRDPVRPPNTARYLFLDPRAKSFYAEWEKVANETVAVLRGAAGQNPYDRALSDLVGMLATRSDEFRVRWASHDVRFHRSGAKRLHHPLVGDLTLSYELLDIPGETALTLVTYAAEPGTPSHERLLELARWSATRNKLNAVEVTSEP